MNSKGMSPRRDSGENVQKRCYEDQLYYDRRNYRLYIKNRMFPYLQHFADFFDFIRHTYIYTPTHTRACVYTYTF